MIRILIIENNASNNNLLKNVFDSYPLDIEPIFFDHSPTTINRFITGQFKVDLVIASLNISSKTEDSALDPLKAAITPIPTIVFSNTIGKYGVKHAFKNGARGYLTEKSLPDEIMYAVSHVNNGHSYISSDLSLESFQLDDGYVESDLDLRSRIYLSISQQNVLNEVANGLTNIAIAEKLLISRRTAEGIRAALLTKTGTLNTASLISFAFRNGHLT